MRSVAILATLAVLGSIPLVTPAYATDLETFQKAVGKVVVPVGSKPKVHCTCPNTVPGHAIAGRLVRTTHVVAGPITFVKVYCEVPGFDAQGDIAGYDTCPDFTVLAK